MASMILVPLFVWCFVYMYDFVIGISNITEFIVVLIAVGSLVIGIYFWGSILIIKRKMTREFRKKMRLDADRRIQENPDCEATRILYGKSDNK